ncbi:unnamed protein product, partial [Closterium sp. NIES-54]
VKRLSSSPPAFKARYVAKGFSQRWGVDHFQTFSSIPKMTALLSESEGLGFESQCMHFRHPSAGGRKRTSGDPRLILGKAYMLFVLGGDRRTDPLLNKPFYPNAFLHGSLHEEIWLRFPPGFTGSFPAGTQWSLRRPLYGLRQAPRVWHDTLKTTLVALGFAPSTADPSLFLCTDTSLLLFYVLMYADDLVFATANTKALTLVKLELQKRHNCTDLGELRSYLGLQIIQDRAWRTIMLTQSYMVHQVLH